MTTRAPTRPDASLQRAIEDALVLGVFVGYGQSWSFIEGLEAIRARITPLLTKGEAGRAVALLETFIAGCFEKSEEIDDSSGSFGQFVVDLFCDWIRARQAAGADATATVKMLLDWAENDDYGYCHRLETQVVNVLDRAGLAALERVVRDRPTEADTGAYAHRAKVETLKAIHEVRRDVGAYAALCEDEDDVAPADCEVLAQMCLKRRRLEAALVWIERGLDLEQGAKNAGRRPTRPSWQLTQLHREVLKRLGRSGEALASAWEAYQRSPSVHTYEDLMKFVAPDERATWREKAMDPLAQADLSSQIDVLVRTKERTRLAEAVEAASPSDLMALSHYTAEPAATRLKQGHPLACAKLHVAMALRILVAKKSRYYDAALENLRKARQILQKQGRAREWEALASEIRGEHRRKTGFMPGFERLAAGRSFREPSFAERARKRWRQGTDSRHDP
jgi:tetratricopeptide (TPR) repeat protein